MNATPNLSHRPEWVKNTLPERQKSPQPTESEQIAYLKMLQDTLNRLTRQIVGSRNWCIAILATTLAWFTQGAAGLTVYIVEILFCSLTCLFFSWQNARHLALRDLFQRRYDRLAECFPSAHDEKIFCINPRIFAPDFCLHAATKQEWLTWKIGGIYFAGWLFFVLAMLMTYIGLSAEHHLKVLAHLHGSH